MTNRYYVLHQMRGTGDKFELLPPEQGKTLQRDVGTNINYKSYTTSDDHRINEITFIIYSQHGHFPTSKRALELAEEALEWAKQQEQLK